MLSREGVESNMAVYRYDIQVLRGIAVLLVLFYHAGLSGLGAGYLGVDLFFVISGFLITGIISRDINRGQFSFKNFYFRRARRLLPSAYVVVFFTVIFSPFFLSQFDLDSLKYQVFGAITFTANGVFWLQSGYFDGASETKPLLHFWSLAIEEQYYLILPLFLFIAPARVWVKAIVFFGVASFALSLYMSKNHPDAAFYLLPTRIWEFALGSVLALFHVKKPLPGLVGLVGVLIILLVSFFPTGLPHPGIDSFIVCVAVLFVLASNDSERIWASFPLKPVLWFGNVSYSLYLVHWPVIVFVRSWYFEEPAVSAMVGAVVGSVLLSALLYKFVEEPFRKGLNRSVKTVLVLVVASSVLVAFPLAVNAVLQRVGGYEPVFFGHFPCGVKGDRSSLAMPECSFGAEESKEGKILLIGDSHSRQFAYGLSKSGLAEDYGFHSIFAGRCLPFPGRVPLRDGRIDSACVDAKANTKAALTKGDYDLVLVAGRWTIYDPLTADELQWLKEGAQAPVILLGPVPNPKFHRACLFGGTTCREVRLTEEDVSVNRELMKVAAAVGIEYVDFLGSGCHREGCPFYIGKQSVYSDNNHLSMVGSTYYSDFLIDMASVSLNSKPVNH